MKYRSHKPALLLLTAMFSLLFISVHSFGQNGMHADSAALKKWFPKYDFDIASFMKPSLQFAPFARWWWPGNNVTKEELIREVNLFADNHFGGVEIQPAIIIYTPGTKEDRDKAATWDTPEYYENLRAVLEEARKRGLIGGANSEQQTCHDAR